MCNPLHACADYRPATVSQHRGWVVFIDDDESLREANVQYLQLNGFEVQAFESASAALEVIDPFFAGVVVSDIRMPQMDGHQLFSQVQAVDPEIPIIFISGHADISEAMEAMRRGAYDFIVKPYSEALLVERIKRALEKRALVLDNRRLSDLADEAASSWPLIGRSAAMEKLRKDIVQLAQADVDTLVEGETGVGKELTARALHNLGPRRRHPFVAINCGALPAAMVETELFGHEAGAFPGAVNQRVGLIQFANRGTLFLDELEAMPNAIQVKLLRFLAEREITPLGSNEVRAVDVKIVAAVKPGCAEGREATVRPDLLHRLKVGHLVVPPLRERRSDIPMLFAHFVTRTADRIGRTPPGMGSGVQRLLVENAWPGNVRELANFAKRFALGLEEVADDGAATPRTPTGLRDRVDLYEAELIREALAASQGDVRQVIEVLQLPRETFYFKARKHEIDLESFRNDQRQSDRFHTKSTQRDASP